MTKMIRLELNEWEAMWVWRMADVMTDLSNMSSGMVMMESTSVNHGLGEIARHVRDELSRQGVSGDSAVALERVP